jgi:hypothetical protein
MKPKSSSSEYAGIFKEIYRSNEVELNNEPILMRAKRVEQLLDISPSSRKRLVENKDLVVVKADRGKPNSSIRITRESVIHLISTWEAEAEYEDARK